MADRWLAPIFASTLPKNQQFADKHWRASDRTAVAITLEQYLSLLDWSGRQARIRQGGNDSQPLGSDP